MGQGAGDGGSSGAGGGTQTRKDSSPEALGAFGAEFAYFDHDADGLITRADIEECLVQFGIDPLSVRAPDDRSAIDEVCV